MRGEDQQQQDVFSYVSLEERVLRDHPLRAWASQKSFRKKDGEDEQGAEFRGQKRTNETHESKTDADAKLYRKGHGQEARLSYLGHVLMENRNGMIVDALLTQADGTAEREAALILMHRQ